MEQLLLLSIIALPLLCAGLFLLLRGSLERLRTPLVVGCCAVMTFCAVNLSSQLLISGKQLVIPTEGLQGVGGIITVIDIIVIASILYFGVKLKNALTIVFSVLQCGGLIYLEAVLQPQEPANAVSMDYLSVTLLLLSSIVGSIVAIYAIGYMKGHEQHLKLKRSRQPRFFALVFLFLAAMNALAITDNLSWLYTFWEITTLCSFLLISHDKTDIAIKNATRALWMNSLGGAAFISGIIMVYTSNYTLQISEIISQGNPSGIHSLLSFGVALLCLAGFTKSAQFPFQKWLLGAMVAPTPVSALLHSSTMVKAGVYLIVRFSPLFGGLLLGKVVAAIGAFTFMTASAIAISQSNGKKVLAYSTIANLGLVIACAGIGNRIAFAAAILLIIYHAISKGLLFMCVGMVELEIGSRNIEDMQGMFKIMPFTTVTMVIGMISMLLPPFGVLATKWLAIESAVYSPVVMVLIILGSAFTVVFWVKWIGIILTMSHKEKRWLEKLPPSVVFSFSALLIMIFAASIGIHGLFNLFVAPQIALSGLGDGVSISGVGGGLEMAQKGAVSPLGGFTGVPLIFTVAAALIIVMYIIEKLRPEKFKPPYVGGELANDDCRGIEFVGPMDKVGNIEVHNYYLSGVFSEMRLSAAATAVAIALIIVMFGVII